jgi:S1-C subfamily serine protease
LKTAIGYPFAGVSELRQPSAHFKTDLRQPTDGLLTGGYRVSETIEPLERIGIELLAKRIRPAKGGYSVGHFRITAGTIATCVYDILPGGSTNPPSHGTGIPSRYYILSNNHVLANSNDASIGDPILQPGSFDGGTAPADIIARLNRFIPIDFEPPIPRSQHRNLVDAAVAEGEFHDLNREIYWNGYVRGWRRKSDVRVGMPVYKTGRTTNFTSGRITAINATVDVGYGGGRVARFIDQIVTTNISAGGDSGSLVTTLVNNAPVAVGLLFAGSSVATIVNQIENVRSLLRVEVAEQIL